MGYCDYLAHHGILGQKWGIRRFQNKDGTWTSKGLEQRRANYKYKLTNAEKNNLKKTQYDYINFKTLDRDYDIVQQALKDGVIKKGTPLYRASSNANETIDERRKYASITQAGASNYIDQLYWGNLYANKFLKEEVPTEYRYEASKDLKVASIEDMRQEAKKKYEEDHPYLDKLYKKTHKKEEESDYYNKTMMDLDHYIDTTNYKKSNDFYNRMIDKGYDVIPDIVDMGWKTETSVASGAMIFLKPYESMKLTDSYDLKLKVNKGESFVNELIGEGIESARSSGKLDAYKLAHSLFLIHHGVKGQKWGVRNGPPYPIEDKVMKKGTVLRSVSGKYLSGQSYKNVNRPIYTFNPNDEWDSKVYKGPFAYYDIMYRGAQFVAEHEFETARDLKMPTSKERIDEFKDLYNDKKFNKKVRKEMKSVQKLLKNANVGSEASRNVNIDKLNTEEDFKAAYEVFNHNMEAAHRYKSTTEYIKRMSSKYDAMVDDNNVNTYNAAHDPVIIFKTDDLIERNGGIPISFLNPTDIVNDVNYIDTELRKKGDHVKF